MDRQRARQAYLQANIPLMGDDTFENMRLDPGIFIRRPGGSPAEHYIQNLERRVYPNEPLTAVSPPAYYNSPAPSTPGLEDVCAPSYHDSVSPIGINDFSVPQFYDSRSNPGNATVSSLGAPSHASGSNVSNNGLGNLNDVSIVC